MEHAQAAKRRKNAAHGASRGPHQLKMSKPQKGRKKSCSGKGTTSVAPISLHKNKTLSFRAKRGICSPIPLPCPPRCKLTRESRHKTIQHKSKIYVNGDIYTNTVFSLLKCGIVGSWHRISAKHLSAYLDEMTWCFNNRKNPIFSATRCGSSFSPTTLNTSN
jgi:ISXO2-like transposase domain